jgi:putative PIN family toxin of toxin-antitoxin system
MIDTNIAISAALFPNGQTAAFLKKLVQKHKLYICTFSIDEVFIVVKRKFPDKADVIDAFLRNLSYELVYTPLVLDKSKIPQIRDEKDAPILLSAFDSDVDVLISGDKDLLCVDCERPKILSPRDFSEVYGLQ